MQDGFFKPQQMTTARARGPPLTVMPRSSSLANSTAITTRFFRNQRFIVAGILATFVLFLFITSFAAHRHIKQNPETLQKLGTKISGKMWGSQ